MTNEHDTRDTQGPPEGEGARAGGAGAPSRLKGGSVFDRLSAIEEALAEALRPRGLGTLEPPVVLTGPEPLQRALAEAHNREAALGRRVAELEDERADVRTVLLSLLEEDGPPNREARTTELLGRFLDATKKAKRRVEAEVERLRGSLRALLEASSRVAGEQADPFAAERVYRAELEAKGLEVRQLAPLRPLHEWTEKCPFDTAAVATRRAVACAEVPDLPARCDECDGVAEGCDGPEVEE